MIDFERFARNIESWSEEVKNKSNELASEIGQLSRKLDQVEAAVERNKHIGEIIQIVTAEYSSGSAYTNLIIIAGYVVYFTMWSFLGETLSVSLLNWSALFMFVSVVGFVSFEVYKMFWLSYRVHKQVKIITDDPDNSYQQITESHKRQRRGTLLFGQIWIFHLCLIIPTSLVALGLMLLGLIRELEF